MRNVRYILIAASISFLLALSFVTSAVAETVEHYSGTIIVKRLIKDNGYIYEYTNEDLYGDEWNHWGRLTLAYELAGYKTWGWGATQVTVTEYTGSYEPMPDSDIWSNVVIGERRVSYIYDYHNEYLNLDTSTNGWTMRDKAIYTDDGTTLAEHFIYNESGSMERHSIYDAAGSLSEDYFYDASGRLIRNDLVSSNLYYTYTYFGSIANPRYKLEYQRSTDTLLNTYELITDDFYIKKEADGHIYSYNKVSGSWLTNTQYDPDGTASFYHYNGSLVRDGVTKYYTNGNRERLDGDWKLREKIESANSFMKGGNLPWISYGYDLGCPDQWTGFSTSDNKKRLIEGLSNFSGGTVRLFLFTDLRNTIDFSGPVLRFYDEEKLYRDMDALLESAAITGTKLIPALFDYWLAFGSSTGDSGHPEVIKNGTKRAELMALIGRFIDHYKNDSRIAMWDLINEPYYGTNASPWGNGRTDGSGNPMLSTVSVTEMRIFMEALLATVRAKDPGKDVTIGFANKETMGQYWSSFIDGIGYDIDIIQIHYWAKYYGYNFNELDFSASDPMFNGKPVFIGEIDPQYYPLYQTDPDFRARLDAIFAAGYMGGLFWQGDGYTDPITPEDMQKLQEWYRGTKYFFYLSGRMESKEFPSQDVYGNLYYHHLDEAFDHNGDGSIGADENYGRLDKQVSAQADGDGAISYEYEYFTGTKVFSVKRCYSDANFTNLIVTYSYYSSSRMHIKTLASGTAYEYSNEDWNGHNYGKLLKETRPDGTYKTFEEYFAGTNQARYIKEYAADGTLIVTYEYDAAGTLIGTIDNGITYTYYDSGRMHTKTVASTGVTYEYSDENWNGKAYGKLLKETQADGSYKTFEDYYTDSDQAKFVKEYDSLGNLLVAYEYDALGHLMG
ncbi:MAG: hypothetical protein WCT15_02660, partial [Candidatus Omnitrophota bacterium]